MSGNEWHGEPHTLIVRAVHAPHGPLDDGCLDYDLEHPPSCKQERSGDGGDYSYWTCDVAFHEVGSGLPSSLRYSGTPITEPGTYRIQTWGYKTWTELGDEYDGGVAVMEPETPPSDVETWGLVLQLGHWDHGGWTTDSRDGVLVCACGDVLREAEGAKA